MGACLGKKEKPEVHRSLRTQHKSAKQNMMRQRDTDIAQFYDIDATIGRGSIGTVARAKHKESSKWYAVKTLQTSKMSKDALEEMMNEIAIMMGLDHPNIVRPLELFQKKREIYLIIPYCSGGDLYKRAPYTEHHASRYIAQVCDAVAYMHKFGVVHRDLKFENVLFQSKAPESEVVVIDFGLAKAKVARDKRLHDFVGTLYSMAPEVLRGSYDAKCDVWSIGVISYMMLASAMPFTRFDDEELLLRDLEAERYDMRRRCIRKRSEDARDFVRSLLKAKVKERPTMAAVLKLPWIKGKNRDHEPSPNSERASFTETLSEQDLAGSLREYSATSAIRRVGLMVIAHRTEADSVRTLRKAFRAIDTGGEGYITFQELEDVLQTQGHTTEEIKDIFDAVDHANDQRISYTEFLAAMLDGQSHLQEDALLDAFDRIDSDDSGFISFENLRDLLGRQFSPQLVQQMIADADFKENGVIDYEEFKQMMLGSRPARRLADEAASE